jgi:hypothetical protein
MTDQTQAAQTIVETSQHKTNKNKKIFATESIKKSDDSDVVKAFEAQKPLDLSIPFTDVDKSDRLSEPTAGSSDQNSNYFASENKKKRRPLEVGGRLLMSPEPETEKQKSADGAGIVINLKP